jgi:hypothetical protein
MADPFAQFRYNAFRDVRNDVADSFNQAVYHDDLPGEIASPIHTFLMSGPPNAATILEQPDGIDMLTPIGLLQDVSVSAQRTLTPATELGVKYHRPIPGRFVHSVNIQRVLSWSANLVGMLYRWAVNNPEIQYAFAPHEGQSTHLANVRVSLQLVGLESDLIELPFGLYLVDMTESAEFISSTYLERCMIGGYSKGANVNGTFTLENVSCMYMRPVPMKNVLNLPVKETFTFATDPGTDNLGLPVLAPPQLLP